MNKGLKGVTTEELLNELITRHGTFKAVAEAQLLVLKKSEDYNGKSEPGADRDIYFPFGELSYAQMIWTKALRFKSLAGKKTHNYEGLRDTALDLINYASFYLDWSDRKQ